MINTEIRRNGRNRTVEGKSSVLAIRQGIYVYFAGEEQNRDDPNAEGLRAPISVAETTGMCADSAQHKPNSATRWCG